MGLLFEWGVRPLILSREPKLLRVYYRSFDFCATGAHDGPSENLGQVVFGERIRSSPYKIHFKKDDKKCIATCTKKYDLGSADDKKKIAQLRKGMSMNYQHHWIVDNMPVTWCYPVESGQQYCATGFPMGCYVDQQGNPKVFV